MRNQNREWRCRVWRDHGDDIELMQVGVSRSWMSMMKVCAWGKDYLVRDREWVKRCGTRQAIGCTSCS
jgi:hypothetical protein